MTRREAVLAIDQGGHSSRARVYDLDGRLLAEARREVAAAAGRGFEQDPRALLESVREAVAGALAATPAGVTVTRAGLAVQRATVVCWRRHSGEPLSPAISWQDTRGAAYLEGFDGPRRQDIRRRTGLPCSPHYGASKLRWCLEHVPAVAAALAAGELRCGPLGSYLADRLLQAARPRVDPTLACRTLLWNRHRRDWDGELLRLFKLPESVLPVSVASLAPHGRLNRWPAIELGLLCGDQPAALAAYEPLDRGDLLINLGTGAFLQQSVRADALPPAGLLLCPAASGTGAVLEGTVNGAAAALDTLDAEQAAALADWPWEADAPLFLNAVGGIGSPYWRSDLASRFLGEADPAGRARAVAESVLFLIRRNVDALRTRAPLGRVVITGGLSRAAWLAPRLAALLEVPLLRPQEIEATGRGIAALLGAAPARLDDAQVFPPRPAPGLSARYQRWCAMMESMASPPLDGE